MRQTVGNACGTIGLLHAIGNVTSEIKLGNFSLFSFPWQLFLLLFMDDLSHAFIMYDIFASYSYGFSCVGKLYVIITEGKLLN